MEQLEQARHRLRPQLLGLPLDLATVREVCVAPRRALSERGDCGSCDLSGDADRRGHRILLSRRGGGKLGANCVGSNSPGPMPVYQLFRLSRQAYDAARAERGHERRIGLPGVMSDRLAIRRGRPRAARGRQ
jgi:hypothetical protein